ncbi:MAG: hypothetical protein LBR08_05540 [Bacteroidales bacterium]|jgi:polygalacturonase|nr:hypothetical protein [Bacteroidales bacterium]
MKKFFFSFFVAICALNLSAQTDYKASVFGCMSDGITLNTQSIQTAINIISSRGGGMLHFYVGRYLTGTIFLKNNVTIVLHEGATLVGVPSAYDYAGLPGVPKGLIVAHGQSNIGVVGSTPEYQTNMDVIGNGIIEGQGKSVRKSIETQIAKGYLNETIEQASPALISFSECTGVKVTGLMLREAAGDVVTYNDCKNVETAGLLIESKDIAGSNGLVFSKCTGLNVTNNFFNVSGKPIKSSANSKEVKSSDNRTFAGSLSKITK